MIVVDTNVVSELMRPSQDPTVRGWALAHPGGALMTTAVTVAEIGYGIARLPAGRRRDLLGTTADAIFRSFANEVLPFDSDAARHYASIMSEREREGRPIDVSDGQIASICRSRGAALATRNVRDFDGTGIGVVDPWRSA